MPDSPRIDAPARSRRPRWQTVAVALVAAVAVYALVGFLVLPLAARHLVQSRLAQWSGRPVALESVRFNPFTWRASLAELVIDDPGSGTRLLELDALELRLSPVSLRRLAPVVSQLRLRGLRSHLVLLEDGRWNVADLLERPSSSPPAPTPSFSIANIELADGRVSVEDRPRGLMHRLESVQLAVPFLSSLPIDEQVVVEPRFSAVADGAPIEAQASARPFAPTRESSLELELERLDLTRFVRYLPQPTPVELRSALLQARLRVHFLRPPQGEPSVELSGQAQLTDLAIVQPGGAALLQWGSLRAVLERLDAVGGQAHLSQVTLEGARLALSLDESRWAPAAPLARWLDRFGGGDAARSGDATPTSPSPRLRIDRLAIDGAQVDFVDRRRDGIYSLPVTAVDLQVRDLDSAGKEPATIALKAKAAAGETLSIDGRALASERSLDLVARLDGIRLQSLRPYVRQLATQPTAGRLQASSRVRWRPAAGLELDDLQAAVDELEVRQAGTVVARAGRMAVEGVRVVPEQRLVDARLARVEAGAVALARAPDGAVMLVAPGAAGEGAAVGRASTAGPRGASAELRAPSVQPQAPVTKPQAPATKPQAPVTKPQAPVTKPQAPVTKPQAPMTEPQAPMTEPRVDRDAPAAPTKGGDLDAGQSEGWRWSLGRLRIERTAVQWDDRSVRSAARLRVTVDEASADGLHSGPAQRARVSLRARAAEGGSLSAQGEVVIDRVVSAVLDVALEAVALRPFRPYHAAVVDPRITEGTVSAKGRLEVVRAPDGPIRIDWRGSASADRLRVVSPDDGDVLLRWRSLRLSDTAVTVDPARSPSWSASLGEVEAERFFARIELDSSGRLNLDEMAGRPRRTTSGPARPLMAAAPGADATAPPPGRSGSAEGSGRLRIGRIVLRDGTVAFRDNFIRPNYSANVQRIEGTVSSLAPGTPGQVDLRGALNDRAPVRLTGSIDPFSERLALDLRGEARGVDLPPLSPYSVRYAGYGITGGKLSMTVHYRIEARQLTADNRLTLERLTFGDPVGQEPANRLPVHLIVSLLQDRDGTIDLDLPISGTLDDPQFSIAAVIGKAIGNAVKRVLTAPFAFLASLGRGEGDHQASGAAGGMPGDAGASASEGQAMSDRSIVGFAAGSSEVSMRSQRTLAAIARGLEARPGLSLSLTGHADAAVDRRALQDAAFRRLLREHGATPPDDDPARADPQALAAAYQAAKLPDKPRNALGLALQVPPAKMEELLRSSIRIPDERLVALASERAQAVQATLMSQGVGPERLVVAQPVVDASPVSGAAADGHLGAPPDTAVQPDAAAQAAATDGLGRSDAGASTSRGRSAAAQVRGVELSLR